MQAGDRVRLNGDYPISDLDHYDRVCIPAGATGVAREIHLARPPRNVETAWVLFDMGLLVDVPTVWVTVI